MQHIAWSYITSSEWECSGKEMEGWRAQLCKLKIIRACLSSSQTDKDGSEKWAPVQRQKERALTHRLIQINTLLLSFSPLPVVPTMTDTCLCLFSFEIIMFFAFSDPCFQNLHMNHFWDCFMSNCFISNLGFFRILFCLFWSMCHTSNGMFSQPGGPELHFSWHGSWTFNSKPVGHLLICSRDFPHNNSLCAIEFHLRTDLRSLTISLF